MVEMRRDPPAASRLSAFDDEVVADDFVRDAVGRKSGGDRREAIALLDPKFMQAAHAGRALCECGGDSENGIFVDHRGRPRRRGIDAGQFARAHAQVRNVLAAFDPPVENFDLCAHFQKRRQKPGAQRVHHHAFDHDIGARRDERGDDRKSGRRRVGGHDDRIGTQFGTPGEGDAPPFALDFYAHIGAEMGEHLFGVIAGRLRFKDRRGSAGV